MCSQSTQMYYHFSLVLLFNELLKHNINEKSKLILMFC